MCARMRMCVHVLVLACHVCMPVYVCMDFLCVGMCMWVCMPVCVYVCVNVCGCVRISVCMCVGECVCKCICVCAVACVSVCKDVCNFKHVEFTRNKHPHIFKTMTNRTHSEDDHN